MTASSAGASASVSVVVADDHPVVRQGIVALLGSADGIDVVAEVADGRAATDAALAHRPSVVVMDLRMPEVDGVEAIGAIRAVWPDARILVLTTYDTDEAIVRAVEAGASGYVLKDTPADALIDAVRRAASGETVLAPPVAKRLVERVREPAAATLTSREIEIIREVANGNSNAVIADHLHISQATVKTHLIHIYDKLGVSDRAGAVARAYETGILTI